MILRSLLLLTAAGVLAACAAPTEELRDGVIVAHGNTRVELGTGPPVHETRTPVAFDDVVSITADIACANPDGISDLQRRAAISRALEVRKLDQASFDAVLQAHRDDMAFAEALALAMGQQCPAVLDAILSPNSTH